MRFGGFGPVRFLSMLLLGSGACLALFFLFIGFLALSVDDPFFVDSTLGEFSVWLSGRVEAVSTDLRVVLPTTRTILVIWSSLALLFTLIGVLGLWFNRTWSRFALMLALVLVDLLLFIVPTLEGQNTLAPILVTITLLLALLLFAPGKITRVLGFLVVLSALFVAWESLKSFAASINFNVTLPQQRWAYTPYPTLEASLAALQNGEISAVFADRKDLEDLISPYPPSEDIDPSALPYPDLRQLNRLETDQGVLFLPIRPNFPGRMAIAVRADEAENWQAISQFLGARIGAVSGSYAETDFLSLPRNLILIDLKILNDLNLPHIQNIAEAFLQPARRNGPVLLVQILAEAALYTWSEALLGFAIGASLGFVLGSLFAHSRLMQRGLLPYVVASQTVPILALAPMIVIWLGAGPTAVAVIAAYITFFPVTINTMRGLQSPNPTAIELMHSYAASKWTIMWKLRFPAALPYIFTALKVSATASVVGAIIGELPSSIRDGLGRAILDFSSDYSLISTPKLWAAIIMAAAAGIIFFLIVGAVERIALRGHFQTIEAA